MIENRCKARFNKIITCDGEYMESERLCLRHAILFDIWIAEYDGWKVYGYENREADPQKLRRWKRAQFHKWLNNLTPEKAAILMEEK